MRATAGSENGRGALIGALPSWRDGRAKQAILQFVRAVGGHDGSEPVPLEQRVAVFDNDGTLWCEKPVPIQMDFILGATSCGQSARRCTAFRASGSMLAFIQHDDKPFLRLLVLHDDAEREFDYTTGAEQALDQAARAGWMTVSVRKDWATVF